MPDERQLAPWALHAAPHADKVGRVAGADGAAVVLDLSGYRVRMHRRALLAALLVAGACGLSACSNSPSAAKEPAPAALLAAAKQKFDETTGMSLTLTSAAVPKGINGVSGANGVGVVNPAPAFKGTVNATVSGVTGRVEVIAVDKDVYMKLFTPNYNKVDPALFGAPNPAQLFNKTTGISTLLPATTDLVRGDRAREGNDVLKTVKGRVKGDRIAALFVFGDKAGTFDVTYGLDEQTGQLRKATMTGPFFAGTTSTYTLLLTDYGTSTSIMKP
jgi:lipoprotein LprG